MLVCGDVEERGIGQDRVEQKRGYLELYWFGMGYWGFYFNMIECIVCFQVYEQYSLNYVFRDGFDCCRIIWRKSDREEWS